MNSSGLLLVLSILAAPADSLDLPVGAATQDLAPDLAEVEAVIRDYQETFAEWVRSVSAAIDPEQRAALVAAQPRPESFAPRLRELARRAPDSPAAFHAQRWIYVEVKDAAQREAALDELLERFLEDGAMLELCPCLERDEADSARAALEDLVLHSPHAPVRGFALLSLAAWILRFDEEGVDEATRLLEEEIGPYAELADPRGGTMAEAAAAQLFELRRLAVGQVLPELVGTGLDGEPLDLAALRGQVVLLPFWAHW